MIVLTLPPPISANVYWRTALRGGRAMTYVSAEAKAYKASVARLIAAAGVRGPIAGRVAIDIQLYPQRPQDWARRARKAPLTWDDDVRCLDLDNANKVLLDSLKGLAIEDDRWVREIHARRMEPDGAARVVVRITPLTLPTSLQASLLTAMA